MASFNDTNGPEDTGISPPVELPGFEGYTGDQVLNALARDFEYGLLPEGIVTNRVRQILDQTSDPGTSPDDLREAIADAVLFLRFVHPRTPRTDGEEWRVAPHRSQSEPPRFRPMDGFAPDQDPLRTRDAVSMILMNSGLLPLPVAPRRPEDDAIGSRTWRDLSMALRDSFADDELADLVHPDTPRPNPYREERQARQAPTVVMAQLARLAANLRRRTPRHAA